MRRNPTNRAVVFVSPRKTWNESYYEGFRRMKITSVRTRHIRLPADEPLAGAPALLGPMRDFVTLTLGTEVPARPGLGLEFDEKVCAQYEA